MIRKTAILVVALLATFLCIASLSPFASAQPCDHNVTVEDTCCLENQTWGWFYNETGWNYSSAAHPDWTFLFYLDVDYGDKYWAYCINYTAPLWTDDTFNASIYNAVPTCKNNSIAHILNNWTYSCDHCENVSASQSAIWYFWYINESFCRLDNPQYNHTATPTDPGWESNWIPNCTAHPEACDFINTSINESVPYNISLTPKTGDYIKGTSIPLEAAVDYCGVEEVVTVVFETDNNSCKFENDAKVFDNDTVNGIAKATLTCDASVESANVTVQVKDMKWFEIVDPIGCQATDYQETLRIINLTDDANFTFYELELTPDIRIIKKVNGEDYVTAAHNEIVTFTLNITNTGEANLTNLSVHDAFPLKQANKGLTWTGWAEPPADGAASSIINPGGWIHFTLDWWGYDTTPGNLTQFEPLKPGDSFEITFNATVDPEACGQFRDVAYVTAKSDWGDVSDNDDAFVFVKCNMVPVLTPFGVAALIGLLSLVVILSIRKSVRKKKG